MSRFECVSIQIPTFKLGSVQFYDSIVSRSVYSEYYEYNGNSNLVAQSLKGKMEDLYKRIFVKISNCPECYIKDLKKMREAELFRRKKEEEYAEKKISVRLKKALARMLNKLL